MHTRQCYIVLFPYNACLFLKMQTRYSWNVIVMKNLDWTEKYRPQTLSQVIGHNKALEELRQWAQSWEKGVPKDRAVVVYGRAGIGKTSVAHALGHDMGWEVIELNASDQRTADIIEKVVGSAYKITTLAG